MFFFFLISEWTDILHIAAPLFLLYTVYTIDKLQLQQSILLLRLINQIRSESSSIRYFYSDQARILVICVHVNVVNEDVLK